MSVGRGWKCVPDNRSCDRKTSLANGRVCPRNELYADDTQNRRFAVSDNCRHLRTYQRRISAYIDDVAAWTRSLTTESRKDCRSNVGARLRPDRDISRRPRPRNISDVKSSRTNWPRGQNFVLGLGLEHLSSACPRTFYFGLVKMSVMMELVIIVSLQ